MGAEVMCAYCGEPEPDYALVNRSRGRSHSDLATCIDTLRMQRDTARFSARLHHNALIEECESHKRTIEMIASVDRFVKTLPRPIRWLITR